MEGLPITPRVTPLSAPTANGTGYFKFDPRRLSFGELRSIAKATKSTFWLMCLLKALRISWASGAWAGRRPASTDEIRIGREQLSPAGIEAMGAKRAQLEGLRFRSVLLTGPGENLYPIEVAAEYFVNGAGTIAAKVNYERAHITICVVSFFTELVDGIVLDTAERALLAGGPQIRIEELPGAGMAQLLEAHQKRVERTTTAVRPRASDEELEALVWRNTEAYWDFNIGRGALKEMSGAEVEEARRQTSSVTASGAQPNDPNTAVLVEMNRIATGKSSWKQAVWPFVITLILFVAAGFARFDLEFIVILVITLFFHELGHYVAMRAFGYRNLKMFFVPLAGAAVMGQHYNIPGWKKAVVSLAGPLPGILCGTIAAWMLGDISSSARHFLMFVLILNAINMLPIYPLDGGAYLNAILFCRNAKIELVFRGLAALALAAAAYKFGDWFLGIIAGFTFIGLSLNYRLARLTEKLRRETPLPAAADPNELPLDVRVGVIDQVRQALKRPAHPKILATHALGIFERLNARPPGWVGTVILLFVYLGTFGLAAFGTAGLFRAGGRENPEPDTAFDCDSASPMGRLKAELGVVEWKFDAPSAEAAAAIKEELERYFAMSELQVAPPWASGNELSEAQRAARGDYLKLVSIEREITNELWKREEEWKAEAGEAWNQKRVAHLVARLQTNSAGIDAVVVTWFTNQRALSFSSNSWDEFVRGPGAEGARRLGVGSGDGWTNHLNSAWAEVAATNRSVRIYSMTFLNAAEGAPVFGNYLCAKGCTNIFYSVEQMIFERSER